jgi:platelet-activating factor acetylhydrolase IB subunit beta/gamma
MGRALLVLIVMLATACADAAGAACPPPGAGVATVRPAVRAEIGPARQAQIRRALAAHAYDAIALGDSIMAGWSDDLLRKSLGTRVLNAGFGLDGTEHVLWRLQAPDWRGQSPHFVLLLIGTNDTIYPACDVFWGIEAVVQSAHRVFPNARIVVTSILPRGTNMAGSADKIVAVNAALKAAAPADGFAFFDVHDAFLCGHKTPCALYQPDINLHLTRAGYLLLSDHLQQFLAQLQGAR